MHEPHRFGDPGARTAFVPCLGSRGRYIASAEGVWLDLKDAKVYRLRRRKLVACLSCVNARFRPQESWPMCVGNRVFDMGNASCGGTFSNLGINSPRKKQAAGRFGEAM